jgi:hypothetical protein
MAAWISYSVLVGVIAYPCGSIPTGYWLGKLLKRIDDGHTSLVISDSGPFAKNRKGHPGSNCALWRRAQLGHDATFEPGSNRTV